MSGFQITRRDIQNAFGKARSFRDAGMVHKDKIEGTVGALACQAESGVAALAYGVAEGRLGPIKVGPVSADFAAGLALHAAAIFGFAGKHGDHLHNFATGLIDGYASRIGVGIGARMRAAAGLPIPASVSGTNPRGSYRIAGTNPRGSYHISGTNRPAPLTPAEIASMTSKIR